MKILLATDGSAGSNAAVKEVARRPWPKGSEVKVISAYELRLGPLAEPWILPRDEEKILEAGREQATAIVNDAATKLQGKAKGQLQVTTQVTEGKPKQVILDEAEHWGADLIVVGSHGHQGIERFLLGSTAHPVALHAKCSVEIVRSRG